MGVLWDKICKHATMGVEMGSAAIMPIHEIRLAAHEAITRWSSIKDDNYNHMYKLLGYDIDKEWTVEMTDRDVNILKMLAGPHGYAIYKALLARMKHD